MTTANKDETVKAGADLFTLEGWRPYQLIFALGFLLYAHTLSFDISGFDDDMLLLGNRQLLSTALNIGKIFSSDVFMSGAGLFYRPLLNVSFMVDTLLGGPLFFFFHLTNILLFSAAAALIFLLLVRLGRSRILAFMLSMLFLYHPTLTQAVAWIPGRNDSLLLIFVLVSFINFLKFLESSSKPAFAGYLFFFMAAIFTKETAVAFPLLTGFYMTRVFPGKVSRRVSLAVTAGSALVLLIWFLARTASLTHAPTLGLAIIRNLFLNMPALLVMLGKTIFPFKPEVWPALPEANFGYGLAAAALLAAVLAPSIRTHKNILWFGLLWYTLFILPAILVTKGSPGIAYVWEHRLCLPLAGFLIFLSELKWVKDLDFLQPKTRIASILILMSFACISFLHSYNFSNRIFFWERAVEEAPSASAARLNLGLSYYLGNSPSAAERQYRIAFEINPYEPIVHNNLGIIYADREETALAEQEFEKELKINPGDPKALRNLATLRSGHWFSGRKHCFPNNKKKRLKHQQEKPVAPIS